MARRKKEKSKIAVFDFETDPFKYGRKPEPFVAGFYDGENYHEFWGNKLVDCVDQLIDFLENYPTPLTIYAHNGGKFDFFYLLERGKLENPALIIHGRIVKCTIGKHELRDSYAAIPIPLKAFDKDDIDYALMEPDVRDKHRPEISKYLKKDCTSLHSLISEFVKRFGKKLTIGAASIAELGKLHPVLRLSPDHDAIFRPYYFGGRVQCFESGILPGNWKIYDVNSMYPDAMKNNIHPLGDRYITCFGDNADQQINKRTGKLTNYSGLYFARIIARNKGALPVRLDKGGLDFNQTYGEFFACSHEIEVACKLGLLKIERVLEIRIPFSFQSYDTFVETYGAEKAHWKNEGKKAKDKGDFAYEIFCKAQETFAKLILNSSYGKQGTDPTKFKDYYFLDTSDDDAIIAFEKWKSENDAAELLEDYGRFEIWQSPAPDEKGFYDVAVAASVTSAARAKLLAAIHSSTRPIYCDTDSIICEDIGHGVPIHDSDLGAWKYEGGTDCMYIAGKKLYGCQTHDGKTKMASKGAKLTLDDIKELCAGNVVHWKNDAPAFKLAGGHSFVERNIRKRA